MSYTLVSARCSDSSRYVCPLLFFDGGQSDDIISVSESNYSLVLRMKLFNADEIVRDRRYYR